MPILIAAVVVVGCLCLLNLLLTFGVIRRLREHTSMLTGVGGSEPPPIGLAAGKPPGAFSAVATSGEEVSGAAGLEVVAFFSSWCSICPERVPPFVEYLSGHHIGAGERPGRRRRGQQHATLVPGPARAGSLARVEPTGGVIYVLQVQGLPQLLLDADERGGERTRTGSPPSRPCASPCGHPTACAARRTVMPGGRPRRRAAEAYHGGRGAGRGGGCLPPRAAFFTPRRYPARTAPAVARGGARRGRACWKCCHPLVRSGRSRAGPSSGSPQRSCSGARPACAGWRIPPSSTASTWPSA